MSVSGGVKGIAMLLLLLLRKGGHQGLELGILYKIYMVMSVMKYTAAIAKNALLSRCQHMVGEQV